MRNENELKELLVSNPDMIRFKADNLIIYIGLFRNFKERKYYTFYIEASGKFTGNHFDSLEDALTNAKDLAQWFLEQFNNKYNGDMKKGYTSYAFHSAWTNYGLELEQTMKGGESLELYSNKLSENKTSFKMTRKEILDALEIVLFELECKGMDFLFDFAINDMIPFKYENCNGLNDYHKNLNNAIRVNLYWLTKVWVEYDNSEKIHFEYPIESQVLAQN